MQKPVEISFRKIARTPEIDALIQEGIGHLERICDYIIGCKIAIEKTQKYQDRGNPYRVRIDLTVPPKHEIVAKREPSRGDMHQPLPGVIHETFEAARGQLRELVQRQRRDVKRHSLQKANGYVKKIYPDQGYGFLTNLKGEDVYFHKNSVLHDDFKRLVEGVGVRYNHEMGQKGPQASSLKIVDKPGDLV
ncbi:MAG: cold shock domain-containing protein [Candidatus Omnitrophica bacterium]|nr:cold shock domain-containing protein [Candidatus Omnitrophota bacterium]